MSGSCNLFFCPRTFGHPGLGEEKRKWPISFFGFTHSLSLSVSLPLSPNLGRRGGRGKRNFCLHFRHVQKIGEMPPFKKKKGRRNEYRNEFNFPVRRPPSISHIIGTFLGVSGGWVVGSGSPHLVRVSRFDPAGLPGGL